MKIVMHNSAVSEVLIGTEDGSWTVAANRRGEGSFLISTLIPNEVRELIRLRGMALLSASISPSATQLIAFSSSAFQRPSLDSLSFIAAAFSFFFCFRLLRFISKYLEMNAYLSLTFVILQSLIRCRSWQSGFRHGSVQTFGFWS